MPYTPPRLDDLDARLAADIEARLPGTSPLVRHTFMGAIARSMSGAHHELYGYIEWLSRQIIPDTAESAELDRWGAIWAVTRLPAARAQGTITVTGIADIVVPAGTLWRRGDGVEYSTDAEATLTGGSATVAVTASEAGVEGNAAAAVKLTLISPVLGVISSVPVATEIADGTDLESDDALRARLLARLQSPPRGGTASDYELWAKSASSAVTRAWAKGNVPALGQVTVYLMTDGATPNGIPAAAVVSTVREYIDERRPVTAGLVVSAPTPVALDFTFSAVSPSTAAVRAAIEAELEDLILRESEPGGKILISHIREAISTAAGEEDHNLTSPSADVTHTSAQIAVMGTVTWPA